MSDVSLDVSERAFKEVFNRVTPTPSLPFDGSTSLGPIWIGVDAAIHVEGVGDIDFEDGNTFLLKELKIAWEKLVLRLGFDIPTVHVGRFCIMRWPEDSPFFPGECVWEFPGGELFGGAPDVGPVNTSSARSAAVSRSVSSRTATSSRSRRTRSRWTSIPSRSRTR